MKKLPKIIDQKSIKDIIPTPLGSLILFGMTIITFAFLLLPSNAIAQEAQRTITIVPPALQKTLEKGGKAEGIMKVINDSSQPLKFDVSVQDYIVVDTIGTPNLLPPNTLNKKYSAASWIAVYPSTFTVQPGQKQILNFYIQVPLDAKPGGHYGAVTYTAANSNNTLGTGSKVQTQLGTLFYISVNGAITERALVSKILANPFQEYGPVKILTQIKNLGDLHVKPEGKVVITDLLGKNIQSQTLPSHNIYPETARDYENTVGQQLMIGRFKAQLITAYGKNNNMPLVASVYFWVFPWKIAILVIFAIIALILGIKLWEKKKATEPAEKPKEEAKT